MLRTSLYRLSNSIHYLLIFFFFFFNDTATTEIYTLSLHDALPISDRSRTSRGKRMKTASTSIIRTCITSACSAWELRVRRSEEHTSELQSQSNLVCRLLLEKKKNEGDVRPINEERCSSL